jgi:predicted aspartyl protease
MRFLAAFGGGWVSLLALAAVSLTAQDALHITPMEVVHGKPYVMVMVNGKGPFRFVVDTGTGGQAMVTPELADQLGLPRVGQVRLTDPSGFGGQRTPVFEIDSLQVAGVEFKRVKAVRHVLSNEDGTSMGLLGFTLFHNYLLTLDYPNRRLMLASGALSKDEKGTVLPFLMPDGVPIVTLSIGNLRADAQLDSGGSGLSLPERLVPYLKIASGPVVFGYGQSLSTRFQVKAARLGSDVRLGGFTYAKPLVEINPAFPLANFGSCPMQNFTITFDQNNLLVRLAAKQKVFRIDSLPSVIRMQNAPTNSAKDLGLVPVG